MCWGKTKVEKVNKISVFPSYFKENQYLENFYKPLEKRGWKVTSWRLKNLPYHGILHIHWPEGWSWYDSWQKRLAAILFCIMLPVLKILGSIQVVYTVHNISPHRDNLKGWFGSFIYKRFIRCADSYIHLTEAGRNKFYDATQYSKKPELVVPHPSYFPQLTDICRAGAREKLSLCNDKVILLCAGSVHAYKNVPYLLDLVVKSDFGNSVELVIAGKVYDEELKNILHTHKQNDLFRIVDRFLSDEELEMWVKAADLLILPYRINLNSGLLIYGISCGTPALIRHSQVVEEVVSSMNSTNVQYYSDGKLDERLREVVNELGGSSVRSDAGTEPYRSEQVDSLERFLLGMES